MVTFFLTFWESEEVAPFFENKTIFVNFYECHKFSVTSGNVQKVVVPHFTCSAHEEADTKIIYHVCQILQDCNIIIKCSDTDILIILLSNMHNLKSKSKIWIESGVAGKKKYIDVCEIYNNYGELLCKALAGFHALTGCDYNPSFFRKGKKRPFNVLLKSEKYQKAFYSLGDVDQDHDEIFRTIETFVCHLYGLAPTKRIVSRQVNFLRYKLFNQQYKMNDIDEPFFKKKIKNFDASSLPPCKVELYEHFLRARYITNIWLNAHKSVPTILIPTDYGWKLANDNSYKFKWFNGQQLPETIRDIVLEDESENEIDDFECESDDENDDDDIEESNDNCIMDDDDD